MGGGICLGQFFFAQSNLIESWHQEQCAGFKYTNNEVAAGAEQLGEDWGFLLTLDTLAGGDMQKEDMILDQPLSRVYRKIQLNAQRNAFQRRYENIVNRTR